MPDISNLTIRVDALLRDEAEHVFTELGLSADDAMTLFFQQVKKCHKLPFDAELPNALTRRFFQNTDARQQLVRCQDAEDMFRKLGI